MNLKDGKHSHKHRKRELALQTARDAFEVQGGGCKGGGEKWWV